MTEVTKATEVKEMTEVTEMTEMKEVKQRIEDAVACFQRFFFGFAGHIGVTTTERP